MYFNNNSVKVSRQFFFLRVSTFLIGCCFFKLLIKRARESRELRDFSGSGSGSGSTKKQWLHGSGSGSAPQACCYLFSAYTNLFFFCRFYGSFQMRKCF